MLVEVAGGKTARVELERDFAPVKNAKKRGRHSKPATQSSQRSTSTRLATATGATAFTKNYNLRGRKN